MSDATVHTGITAPTDGITVHTTGSGPALVLLHGNGGDHRDFAAVVDRLAAEHTVHAIDWPGWGPEGVTGTGTGTGAEPTATGYADLLPAVLRRLPSGPFVLVGNSVGGFAAIRAAARHPGLVSGLVLVDPGGFTRRWPGSIAACRLIGWPPLAPTMMRLLPRLYLRRRSPTVTALRAAAVARSHDPARVRVFASIWRSFARPDHDARDDAARVGVPTLLVWGRRDPVLPWWADGRRARRALPGAEVVALPCGHQAFAETPEAFLGIVMPFLRSIRAGHAWA